jgi:hypothetical protein
MYSSNPLPRLVSFVDVNLVSFNKAKADFKKKTADLLESTEFIKTKVKTFQNGKSHPKICDWHRNLAVAMRERKQKD